MQVVVFARHPSGGIRTYFSYVYGNEALNDFEFSLVTPESAALESLVAPLSNVSVLAKTPESNLKLLIALLRVVLRKRPALVHSHGFTAGLISAFPLWLLRIPHIITTHDVFMPGHFRGAMGTFKKYIMARLFSLARVVNPVGDDAAENFRATFPALTGKGRVVAVRNGIKSAAFLGADSRALRKEAGIPDNSLVVGFFGRFMAQKGFGLLVDAVESWNNSGKHRPLHVCCFGWGGFIREEQESIARRELKEYFHFFPGTDEMGAAIRGVDAVVMPSRWEACPLLAMEVMVAGKPLIASNCIGLKEVTKNTPALIFEVGSLSQLVEQLSLFESRQEYFAVEFSNFRDVAAERFDVSATAESLLGVFNSVLDRPEASK
ncbi:MAG: glycosyltransferase family 4 protein [Pseudomonadota bacterium]|nr:glycosyltransferase family 4 protein [Pseudomonadota bacterium]